MPGLPGEDLPSGRLVPACATPVAEGMQVESETDEIHAVRRSTLELLLSDHLGDCVAPCSFGCPAKMNIPQMLRQIAAGQFREALITVKADIALPAVLGRICPAPCEKVCRRGNLDRAIAICELKRIVANVDLDSAEPYLPPCRAASGKRVAIVGGGPAGLASAYYWPNAAMPARSMMTRLRWAACSAAKSRSRSCPAKCSSARSPRSCVWALPRD